MTQDARVFRVTIEVCRLRDSPAEVCGLGDDPTVYFSVAGARAVMADDGAGGFAPVLYSPHVVHARDSELLRGSRLRVIADIEDTNPDYRLLNQFEYHKDLYGEDNLRSWLEWLLYNYGSSPHNAQAYAYRIASDQSLVI